jgi:DNA-binding transcriptional regulator YbjK
MIAREDTATVAQCKVAAAAGISFASTTYCFRAAEDLVVGAPRNAHDAPVCSFEAMAAAVLTGGCSTPSKSSRR